MPTTATTTSPAFAPAAGLATTLEPADHVLVVGSPTPRDLRVLTDAGLTVTLVPAHGSGAPPVPGPVRLRSLDPRHLPVADGAVAAVWVHRLGDFDQEASTQALTELARVARSGAELYFTGRHGLAGAGTGAWETTHRGRHWVPRWSAPSLSTALLEAGWVPSSVETAADPHRPGVVHLNAIAALL